MNGSRGLRALRTTVYVTLVGAIGACAGGGHDRGGSATTAAAPVPAALRVEGPVVGRVHATGVQIYKGVPGAAGKAEWKFSAPEATFSGDLKGRHYEGPWWECTTDGSKVKGHTLEKADVSADAVPWLLLDASAHEGKGKLAGVSYVQRINTVGGKMPAAAPLKSGDEARVPYTADYVFYGEGAKRGG